MKIFRPDYIFSKTTKITPEFLKKHGIRNLLLDVDNTLTTHNNPLPAEGIMEWLDTMRENGIGMMIISNNSKKRVEPFAKLLGLPFSSMSCKPLPTGYIRGLKLLGSTKENTALVGDQIFTDVMGANLMGMKAIMVLAILEEEGAGFRLKRKIEKGFVEKYLSQQGGPL